MNPVDIPDTSLIIFPEQEGGIENPVSDRQGKMIVFPEIGEVGV